MSVWAAAVVVVLALPHTHAHALPHAHAHALEDNRAARHAQLVEGFVDAVDSTMFDGVVEYLFSTLGQPRAQGR